MKTIFISREQLIEKLRSLRGTTIVSLSAFTDAKAKKSDFGQIMKLSHINGLIGINYENSVNNALDKEGKHNLTFKSSGRKWGTYVSPSLISYNNNFYLQIQLRRVLRSPLLFYKRPDKGYMEQIDKSKVEHLLPDNKKKIEQSADKQGLHSAVIIRDYNLANIKAINMGGEKYRVID